MKFFTLIMVVMVAYSSLYAMDVKNTLTTLVGTLDILNNNLKAGGIENTVPLTPESVPSLVKNFIEQFNKNYDEAEENLKIVLENLENAVNPDLQILNLYFLNEQIKAILPKEFIPLFYIFLFYPDPNKFKQERIELYDTLNPLIELTPSEEFLNNLITIPQTAAFISKQEIFIPFFPSVISSFVGLITQPRETVKEHLDNAQQEITTLKQIIEESQQPLSSFKNLLSRIDTASEDDIKENVRSVYNALITYKFKFDAIFHHLTEFLLNKDLINTFNTLFVTSLEQFKIMADMIENPQILQKIQGKRNKLEQIMIDEENVYQILELLKNIGHGIPQDLKSIKSIFDFYRNLFDTKKFNYEKWETIEKLIEDLTKD